MEREGEKEEEEVGDNTGGQAGLGQGAGVVEEECEPGVDCEREEEEGEKLDSQLGPRDQPRWKNDVLGASYQVDVIGDDQGGLGGGQQEESLHTAAGVHRVEESGGSLSQVPDDLPVAAEHLAQPGNKVQDRPKRKCKQTRGSLTLEENQGGVFHLPRAGKATPVHRTMA